VSRTSRRRALLFALSVAPLGCPTPAQYGGPIPIDTAGFEARARMLCGARLASHANGVCVPDAQPR
jgi:hypothetical protein